MRINEDRPTSDRQHLARDLAHQLLQLEQRVDAYQRLYEEELEQMRRALNEQRRRLLVLLSEQERESVMFSSDGGRESDDDLSR